MFKDIYEEIDHSDDGVEEDLPNVGLEICHGSRGLSGSRMSYHAGAAAEI